MKSRFIHTTKWRLPRHRRSRRLAGAEENRGRYIKCWNCGFIIDTKTYGLGAGDGSGITVADALETPLNIKFLNKSTTLYVEQLNTVGLCAKNGPSGSADLSVYTPRTAEAATGCPFCGTRNLP